MHEIRVDVCGADYARLVDIVQNIVKGAHQTIRIAQQSARRSGGAGLGLSIVRHLLTFPQGTVELETSSESGSVFKVTLIQG